jgi:hypothetical protein
MEQELQKRVLTIAKKNSDIMTEETGVQPSLSEDDMKQYLEEVLKEIKVKKANPDRCITFGNNTIICVLIQ